LFALWLCLPLLAVAQEETGEAAPPAAPPNPCASADHRQFDFWAGDWDVTQNGQPAGHNRIEIIHGGCALAEHWTSASSGFSGSSLNTWDAAGKRWHQTWVDTAGTLLELNGGLRDGSMVLSGERPGPDGSTLHDRISWTSNADGSVRQLWENSTDGKSWSTAFDGLYVRSGSTP
jgi:hypothetical protein